MSWASKNIFDPLKRVLEAAQGNPATASAATQATANLGQAANLVEGSLANLATIGVNAVLGLIPEGTVFEGLADELVSQVIAGLVAKHPNAAAPVATQGSQMGAGG